jgi:hypothetical protein
VTILQVYYHMLSDTQPLFVLFIAVRIILIIVIGRFIRLQYCRFIKVAVRVGSQKS